MKKLIAGAALALIVTAAGGTAFAGEVTGSGKGGPNGDGTPAATQGLAQSICAFSGLADGGEGEPAGPGAPPQSWGQIPREARAAIGTSGAEHPGNACNGATGFLAGGGGEP